MVMALMRKRSKDLGLLNWTIDSAGTWASDGIEATENAILTMQEKGLDIRPHRSRSVTQEMVDNYDLILVMVANHKESLLVEFPEYGHKIYLLSEMVGESWDVEDPVGQPIEEYRETADLLDQVLQDGWERILELAKENAELEDG
jgi:protein-tyrosine-phosphatase